MVWPRVELDTSGPILGASFASLISERKMLKGSCPILRGQRKHGLLNLTII